jgi:hypothetical protein
MAREFAAEDVRAFFSEADLLGRLATVAHECMSSGDEEGAREALANIRERYGDLHGLRMRLDDAARALSGG